jgi:protein phosphatase
MCRLVAAARSDVGRVRSENQDSYGVYPDLGLFIVADGVGGHQSGSEASLLTVTAIRESLLDQTEDDLTPVTDDAGNASIEGRRLVLAIQDANDRVHRAGQAQGSKRMSSTVVALLFDLENELLAVAHVGDSRVYRLRNGHIEQLTEDHTLVREFVKEGRLSPEEARESPHRHYITQAIGSESVVTPSLRLDQIAPHDIFVLCSVGVHDVVTDAEIAAMAGAGPPRLDEACARLIDLANERGGRDNSTVVLVACEAAGGDGRETADAND